MTQVISSIIAIIIIAGLLGYSYITRRNKQEIIDEINEFINSLTDEFLKIVTKTVDDSDPDGFNNFEEFTNNVLIKTYDTVWEFVEKKLENSFSKEKYSIIIKLINKSNVEDTVIKIFNSSSLQDKLESIFNDAARQTIKEMEEEERRAAEEAEKYERDEVDTEEYNGEHDISEFEAGRESMIEPEAPDNEAEYKEDDETMEIIEDTEDESINMMEAIESAVELADEDKEVLSNLNYYPI